MRASSAGRGWAAALVIFIDLFPDVSCIVFLAFLSFFPAVSPLSSFASCGSAEKLWFFQFLQSSGSQRLQQLLDCCSAMKTWVLLLRVCCLGGGGKKEQGRYLHAPLVCVWISFSALCQRCFRDPISKSKKPLIQQRSVPRKT